ncbi:PAAR-like protein [Epilithonimonas ginsengisoli]|uniref:PAAR-like protein n=1 Tax=Epilithonimonas ginsengisoli TaxID=1245592 RepID=A0ABU4JMG7_9FLAO|nr:MULTISPECIES: PAAR-like protein [Chryseobacterium group]MBV6881791.1 DUF4280 domain-containing protein [Epilithonimonas sp. FP105]MDW8550847.1 PAAR-like protein [Epilithonimonas ginsengisoli]OAH68521.1 hypothetical protein AXA65_17080 [Chryseobacterium sp. FP211-J200]
MDEQNTVGSDTEMEVSDLLLANATELEQKRAERNEQEKTEDSLKLVISTATLECILCTNPFGTLIVNYDTPTIQQKKTATVKEKGSQSLVFMGNCKKSPQSASPCASVMQLDEWRDFGTSKSQNEIVLLQKSTIKCNYGNVDIRITDSGQINEPESIDTQGLPLPDEVLDDLEYIYYTEDGFYLGGSESSTKVYLSTQEEYGNAKKDKKWSLINKESNLLKENNKVLTHLKLINLSATCYGECSLEYNVDVKEELYAIAYVHFNHPENVAYGAKSTGAIDFRSKKPLERNNKTMQLAIGASINAYTNGFDFSNGADSWDGIDVLTGGSWNKWLSENHYRQRANGKNKGISDPKNISPDFYATAKKALEDKIASPKVSDKLKKDYHAKYAHLQPLIVYKESKTYKPLFEVVATYAVSIFYKTLK